jgi:phytoene dehydrogenase-like protein
VGADSEQVDVVVVGAGLAGLAAGAAAAGRGARVVVLEAHRPGGRARTVDREGFLLNEGPHALYRRGAGAAALARLGVTWRGWVPPNRDGTALFQGATAALPLGPPSLLATGLLGARDKVQAAALLARLPRLDPVPLADRSAADWVAGLELRPRVALLVRALIRVSTYVDDQAACSADAAVAQLKLAARGSVAYLDGGWATLVEGLAGVLAARGCELRAGGAVRGVSDTPGGYEIQAETGPLRAPAVVLAPGTPAAVTRLLGGDPGLAVGDPVTMATLDLGLRRPPARRFVLGIDQPVYCSRHAPGARLAPPGTALLHLGRYGARSSAEDRAELDQLAAVAGVDQADVVVARFSHRLVVTHGLPRPGSGLSGRPGPGVSDRPGLFVAGDWAGPVGLLGDAALASGEAAGRAAAGQPARSGAGAR